MTVPPNTLADTIAQAIQQGFAQALEQEKGTLAGIADDAGKNNQHDPYGDVGDLGAIVSALTDVIGLLDPAVGLPVQIIKDAEGAAGKSGIGFALGYIVGTIVYQISGPVLAPLQHAVADALQTEIFDPNTAAHLAATGQITPQFGASEAAGGNLDGSHFSAMLDAAYTRPEVAAVLDLFDRGLISDQDVDTAFQKHGIPVFWWGPLKAARLQLLSGPDLALALLRGNMDQGQAETLAAQAGVTPEVLQTFVDNTGEPPGPQELMEALRRGFIDQDRFARGIRQSRVRNEWLDVEYALRQAPMSVSDAVRAVVEGHLTSDEGQAIAVQNGLIPEHWPVLVESWGRPLSHEQMMTLYHRGQATLAEVQQAFRESDLKNKYIDQAVELGRRLIPERLIVQMLDHAVIDHAHALTLLTQQGFDPADAESLIALGSAMHQSTHKTLSRSDILAMYSDALINRQAALQHLQGLGYSTPDATAMLDLADYKRKAATLKTLQRGIEASLKTHHLTQQQAIDQLVSAGLDVHQATTLVDEWLQQRSIVTRTLTEAQVLKAIEATVLDQAAGRTRLKAMGLSDPDITILYQINGILPIP